MFTFYLFQSRDEEYIEFLIEQEKELEEQRRQEIRQEEIKQKVQKAKKKEALIDDLVWLLIHTALNCRVYYRETKHV